MDPRPNTAKVVGDEFARQYYNTLQNAPENLYKLYKDKSTISRPGLDGTMRVFTLSKDLKWRSPGSFDSVKITSVTSQDSLKQGILVVVYGYLTFNERPARHFTQVFFLVPQEKGYIVCTDMFRFVDIPEANAAIPPANDVIEEKVPETEGAALRVSEPNHGFDNVPKLSCASEGAAICAKKLPLDATIAFVENAFKQFGEIRRGGVEVRINWHCTGKYAYVEFEEAEAANRAIMASPISIDGYRTYVEKKYAYNKSADTGNGNSQDSQAITEDAHIRVKDLPPNATVALVESVFKQFGPIKKGRIRVINPANSNYSYAFVEFEEADAAKRAIQASPLNVDGHTTYVEQKQPYYEGYYESPSDGPGNIKRGEGVRGSLGNPICNWQKMEEVRGTDVYDLQNWQKIMNQSEEQMKFQEEEGRQYNQNRYTSEEVRGTEGVGLEEEEEEEENQNWEEQRKIQEEEGTESHEASVFLRRLPLDVTFALIEDALKKFGPINAISIIKSGPLYKFAFVDFEKADVANRAIMASPVRICEKNVNVQKKLSAGAGKRYTRPTCRDTSVPLGAESGHREQGSQNRYGSEQVRGTEAFDFWDWQWQKSKEEQSKLQEEEGEIQVDHSWEEEHSKVLEEESKLQEEAVETQVDHSWDYEQIMEEQEEEESKQNQTSYIEDIAAFFSGVL
ncbi:unnamed protein product [Arabidopsis thaliana]|uniref:Uncharacterized protein n=1 Tax=Arabidopsis thaliana TaxID=3702 RepID=A0A654F6L7_ARATH|nr:unnamed protein product [Arabidopsis thaliana]VYS56605.1 unnamed protein product [Arabidopsis thaliana]